MKSMCALVLIGLIGVVSLSSGCGVFNGTPAGQAPPDSTFSNGKLEATVNDPAIKATEATRLAFMDMKFNVIAFSNEPTGGMVTGIAPNNQRVHVRVQPKDAAHSVLSIDVGDMGNEPQLKEVYSNIKKRL